MRTRRARCAPGLKRSCLPVLSPALQPFYCSGRDRAAWLSVRLPRRCRQLSPLRMECSSTGGFLVIVWPRRGSGDAVHRGRTMAEGGGVDQRGAEGHGRGGGQQGRADHVAEARAARNDGLRDGQQVDVDVFPAGTGVAGDFLRQRLEGDGRTEMAGGRGCMGQVGTAHKGSPGSALTSEGIPEQQGRYEEFLSSLLRRETSKKPQKVLVAMIHDSRILSRADGLVFLPLFF